MTQNEEMLKMEPRKIMKSGNLMSPALFTMVQMLLPRMQRLRARNLLHQFTGLITSYNMMYLPLELEDMCLSLVCDLRGHTGNPSFAVIQNGIQEQL